MKLHLTCLIALSGLWIASSTLAAETSTNHWTLQDLDAVADAYVQATGEMNKSTAASMITLSLADALIKAGDTPKAKEVLVEAARFGADDDFITGEIVEKLAGLKAYEEAQRIVATSKDDHNRILRLGMLGVGYVHSENYAGALKAAADINVVAKINGLVPVAQNEFNFGEPEIAIGRIARELAKSGAADEALKLANTLPNRSFKLQVFGQAASTLCSTKKDIVGNPAKGQALAEQTIKLATLELTTVKLPYEKVDSLVVAGEAVLKCQGSVETKSFVTKAAPQIADDVLYKLADQLANQQELDLSRRIAPQADSNDVESLLDSAKLLMKQKDMEAAKQEAIKVSRLAISNGNNTACDMKKSDQPPQLGHISGTNNQLNAYAKAFLGNGNNTVCGMNKYDYYAQLGRISGTLEQLGDYDNALATYNAIKNGTSQHETYRELIQIQIEKHDTAALKRTLPKAIEVFEKPTEVGDRSARYLLELVRALALGGYKDEAIKLFKEKHSEIENADSTKRNQLAPFQLAQLHVDVDDLKGAYEIANNAGPFEAKPSPMRTVLLATMMLDGARTPPTHDQASAALQRAKAMQPKLVAGPKAGAFSAIATELAMQGDIKGALQADAELNSEHNEALVGIQDSALKAIAEAQLKSGDLHGAFSTTLRITQATVRPEILLKLAVLP